MSLIYLENYVNVSAAFYSIFINIKEGFIVNLFRVRLLLVKGGNENKFKTESTNTGL